MNGWTPTIPTKTKIDNLIEQIPQEYRARATRECYGVDDFEFERNLTGYVLCRVWETYPHPVNEAEFVDDWCDLDGTYPSPYISGGEVIDPSPVKGDEEFQF